MRFLKEGYGGDILQVIPLNFCPRGSAQLAQRNKAAARSKVATRRRTRRRIQRVLLLLSPLLGKNRRYVSTGLRHANPWKRRVVAFCGPPVETFPGNPKEIIIDPSKHSLFRGGMFLRVAENVTAPNQRPVETFLPLHLHAFLPLRLQGFERHRPVETYPESTRKRFYGPSVGAGDPWKHSIKRSSYVETFSGNPPKHFDGGPAKRCVTVETFLYETFRRGCRKNSSS